MTMPPRVIYLPPGVAPTPPTPHAVPGGPGPNVPFNRQFFEQTLPEAIENFCKQTDCSSPIVEILTADGTTHYVNGISGASDTWVALHTTQSDHDHPVQVFVPYTTVFRVGIHAAEDHQRQRLGFIIEPRPQQKELPEPQEDKSGDS